MRRPPLRQLLAFLPLLPSLLGAARIPYADDPWIELTTTNFHLISNAGHESTRDVARRLERFRAAAPILTGATRIDSSLPTRVFVFGDGDSWSHFRDDASLAGYFISDAEANYIGLDMSRAGDERSMETVLHEYVHFLSRNRGSRAHHPTWYEEGLAEAISTARLEDQHILVGAAPGGRAALLAEEKWLPFERVVTARGTDHFDSSEMALFYAQSWLLVHRLTWGHVAGLESRYDALPEYIRRVASGEAEASAFPKTFGLSFEKMQAELREYLEKGPPLVEVGQNAPDAEFELRSRTLPPDAAMVLLGELQLARGDEKALLEAEALARRALEQKPDDPRALILLSGALIRRDTDPGDELAKRALALASEDPAIARGAARVALWRLERSDRSDAERRRLATEARDLYARAVALAPDAAAGHAGLGYAHWALNQPAEADRSLQQAFRMARGDLQLALALGELHARYGRPEDARRLLNEVVGSAHHDAMRARARELLEGIGEGPAD